jgi:N-acetylmuramoyl-L-alanine amidase
VILSALLVCVLQAVAVIGTPAPTARTLTVRVLGSPRAHQVPLVVRSDGQVGVRASVLADALGGSLQRLPDGHFALNVPGATLEVADQSGFATSAAGVIPLPAPAWIDGGALYLPLAVVADVLPRVASGVIYDPAKAEVRVFAPLLPAGQRRAALRQSSTPSLAEIPRPVPRPSPASISADPPLSATADPTPAIVGGADTVGVTPSGDVLLGERDGPAPVPKLSATHHRLVVVDAGHGGPDHGMIGPIGSTHPIYEKNITLAVALKVGDALRRLGVDVLETRTTDTLIALSDRGRIANEHHGDLFLSIHVNAANPNWHDPAAARGFETYFLAEAKTEDDRRVENMENESVRFETGVNAPTDDPLDFIIHDMAQNEHLRESADLAAIIQRHLAGVHPGPDRGVKQAGFRVLVTAYMPAVLVEIGFGTNAAEARYLTSPSAQRTIANAIAEATADYLARYERRVTVGQ